LNKVGSLVCYGINGFSNETVSYIIVLYLI